MTNLKCTKCEGQMELGFLLDHSDSLHYNMHWVPGPASRSEWHSGTVKIPTQKFNVKTYRCKRCGFLESYAEGRE